MHAEILDRLVCAKYLFHVGIETQEASGPYSAGLAVLTFQDAVEMLLRAIAEHLHAPLRDNAPFNQLLDDVESAMGKPLTHRSALLQLNKSRVNFKHSGLAPRDEDTRKFRNDLEGFFPSVLSTAMNVDFNTLSLANLVRHKRCSNWILKAEAAIASEDYGGSLHDSAVAFAVFGGAHHHARFDRDLESTLRHSESRTTGKDSHLHPGIFMLAESIGKEINKIREHMVLISSGIPIDEYQRFRRLTPRILLSDAGTILVDRHGPQGAYEDALFCTNFVIGAALRFQKLYAPDPFERTPMERRYRAVCSGNVIVYPEDKSGEVIRTFTKGEEFVGYYERWDKPGFTAILQDGKCSYVSSSCLEQVT